MEHRASKVSRKMALSLAVIGIVITLLMAVAIVFFGEYVREEMEGYGYLGAFIISILGGATIVVPVPMLAVVFALGGVLCLDYLYHRSRCRYGYLPVGRQASESIPEADGLH